VGLYAQIRAREPLAGLSGPGRRGISSSGAQLAAFVIVPVLLTAFLVRVAVSGHFFAVDFGAGPWVAGGRVFDGLSPYVGPHASALAHGSPFVYPALSAVLLAPFSLISHGLAEAIFTALSMAAVLLTLRAVNVRDWRVYGLVFLWPPVISGWQTANLTLLIGLGIALAWRHREHPVVAGGLIALLISVKVFVWPLALWLLATRRYAALGYAAALGLVMNLIAWAVLGFDQIGVYARLISVLTRIQERRGYSLLALGLGHGLSRTFAYGLALGVAAAAGVGCVALGRRGSDRPAFALSIATCLLATPIIWLHYFALLLVPLALARPRLAPIWFAPLLLVAFPASEPRPWQIVATLIVGGALTAVSMRRAPPGRRRAKAAGPLRSPRTRPAPVAS
jgi:Glycosyltransferase family 87